MRVCDHVHLDGLVTPTASERDLCGDELDLLSPDDSVSCAGSSRSALAPERKGNLAQQVGFVKEQLGLRPSLKLKEAVSQANELMGWEADSRVPLPAQV